MAFKPKTDITEYTNESLLNKELYKLYLRTKDTGYYWKHSALETFNEVYKQLNLILQDTAPGDQIKEKYLNVTKESFGTRYASDYIFCLVWAVLCLQKNIPENLEYFIPVLEAQINQCVYFEPVKKFVEDFHQHYAPRAVTYKNELKVPYRAPIAKTQDMESLRIENERLDEENTILKKRYEELKRNYDSDKALFKTRKEIFISKVNDLEKQLADAMKGQKTVNEITAEIESRRDLLAQALSFDNIIAWCKEQQTIDKAERVIVMLQECIGLSELPNTREYFLKIKGIQLHFQEKEAQQRAQEIFNNYGQYNSQVDRQDVHLQPPSNNNLLGNGRG